MSFDLVKESWRWHFYIFLKALFCFLMLSVILLFLIFPSETELLEKSERISFSHYYPVFSDSIDESYYALKYSLSRGQITVFGSSELSQIESSYIPYNFFSDSLGRPAYGFGHAGFQSRAITTELLATLTPNTIDHGKIAILLSPSWFIEGHGTNESLWKKEIATLTISARIRDNSNLDEAYKQKLLAESVDSYTKLLDRLIIKMIDTAFLWSMNLKPESNSRLIDDNWDHLKSEARQIEISKSTNTFGINDEYFEKYIKPIFGTEKFPFKIKTPPDFVNNQELRDFDELLQVLSKFKTKPIFVILPLNQKAYANSNLLNPTMSYLADQIKKEGFSIFDMWSKAYEPGVLTDAMHMGEYGWMQINEFIDQNFKR